MPNQITAAGVQVSTQSELLTNLTNALKTIYGPDIDLSSNSPDGQAVNIFIQSILDVEDLLVGINNNFDPDQAIGTILDSRIALNGIQRKGGTYTVTNITIVTSQALTLQGLDLYPTNPYTVSDNAGNQWQLMVTQSPSIAGTHVYAFQAANTGAISTIPNTITVAVTTVLGVVSVNNPTTYTTLGIDQETDAQLRLRRQKSVAISSQGFLNGLEALLNNLQGMTFAKVYENTTGTTNGDGVPGHSIWVITAGSASAASIANAIYIKRNAGCGMLGAQSFSITQLDNSIFVVNWDNVVTQNLFIKFTATSLDGINAPQISNLRNNLPLLYIPGVYETVNVNKLAGYIQQIDPNTLASNLGFSTTAGGSYTLTLTPTAKNNQFVILSANIIILPILIVPSSATVVHGGTIQFSALGGYSTYTWSMVSGTGSINPSTGLYTSVSAGTDVAKVTDSLGNFTNVTITVT